MRTVVLDPLPPEIQDLIRRRRVTGADRYDEVWEGDYHMVPGSHLRHAKVQGQLLVLLDPAALRAGLVTCGPFNLGEPENFRVPDGGLCRAAVDGLYVQTAVVVIEVLSPGDETYAKFGFYHAHGVEWIIVADPDARQARLFGRGSEGFDAVDDCPLLGLTVTGLTEAIRWP